MFLCTSYYYVSAAAVLASLGVGRGAAAAGAVWYVSPKGSDTNGGTISLPFKTIQKAKQTVRSSRASGAGAQEVRLLPGTYYLNKTLVFDSSDGGASPEAGTLWTSWLPPPNPFPPTPSTLSTPPAATLSFGIPVEGKAGWSQDTKNPTLWHRLIPEVASGELYPRQLWDELVTSMTHLLFFLPARGH